jgi:hypothetical protein
MRRSFWFWRRPAGSPRAVAAPLRRAGNHAVLVGAVALDERPDPAAVIEDLFEANGWGGRWRNGIYDYVHYHSRIHEVLGIARGKGRVRFGGNTPTICRKCYVHPEVLNSYMRQARA